MKLDNHNKLKPDVEHSIKQRKKKEVEYKYEGSSSLKKGHRVWEINLITMVVSPAEFVKHENIHWFDAIKRMVTGHKSDIQVKKDCVYICALNAKNALERWQKDKGSALAPTGGKIELW